MRNYVILNGKSSEDIQGLLIQSLAPITKPLIRTQVEEIDGRDGDIVTKLGYAAYDKSVTIGLYGDYDVDEVIEFFNSEGTVIFSNEEDKYYYYEILNQIDFQRLIRFREAKVTFHVQPFKYSTEETARTFNVSTNLLNINDFTKTSNGITLTSSDGTIRVQGTGTAATEFYVPLSGVKLNAGSYTLTATASGTNASSSSIRLIGSAPSNADSFGGNYVTLVDDDSVTLTDTLSASKQFNYLWFYINAGTALDFSLTASLENENQTTPQQSSVKIRNDGNIYSKPKLTLYGSGTINLSLNGNQVFVIELGETANHLTIDTKAMDAYKNTPDVLMNRSVDGNYDNFKLNIGSNTIAWSGNLTKLVISNYSRWL